MSVLSLSKHTTFGAKTTNDAVVLEHFPPGEAPFRRNEIGNASPIVITGLVPVIPHKLAMPCVPKRDGRAKPGHDETGRLRHNTG